MQSAPQFFLYSDSVETKAADEDENIQKILDAFNHVQKKTEAKHQRAMRVVHTKSHGSLKGKLTVHANLPSYSAQGAFAVPGDYGVMIRLSTSPAGIAADTVGGVRGVGLKIIGVPGEKLLPEVSSASTQDFLFANHPTFPAKDSKAFLAQANVLDKVVSNLPESVQAAQNTVIRAGGAVARSLGFDPIGTAVGLAKPESNILGETFYTGVPVRYGDYIAKLSLVPISQSLLPLIGQRIDTSDENALRNIVVKFFRDYTAEYELRVQLLTDLKKMPVEDPSVKWSEADSPFVAVAKVSLPIQNVESVARNKYAEDVLSFNPWNCLKSHRPLGSVMRTRKVIYEASSKYRHSKTDSPRTEPTHVDDMPD
jgi:hypothetical protein